MPLIESLEASKLLATEIGEKVAEAAETEIAINDSRNKYRPVAERGAMLFFLLNSLNKIHAFYQYRLVSGARIACTNSYSIVSADQKSMANRPIIWLQPCVAPASVSMCVSINMKAALIVSPTLHVLQGICAARARVL